MLTMYTAWEVSVVEGVGQSIPDILDWGDSLVGSRVQPGMSKH